MFDAELRPSRARIVVGFAGGGGSSLAIEEALGVHPDAALNHWPVALGVHQVNFPDATHFCADIFETDPRWVCPGEPIGLLWLSPDCRHFSKAKGGAPVSPRVRGLAWCAIPWARLRRPDVIMLENVEEFLTWGPLIDGPPGPSGEPRLVPDPARAGQTFERWIRRLRQCGYVVEWKILSAADYGAPTIRKRLFLVARCDGRPIVWPAPSHAPRASCAARGLPAHRAAAEVIDFARPCPSIFLTPDEARAIRVKRPLEPATLARIAKGLYRYTIAAGDPFIVPITHSGEARAHDVRDPLKTITTAHRGEFALIAPVMVPRYGEREGQEPRARDVERPFPTVTATGNEASLAAAYLTKFSENSIGQSPEDPLHTVMAGAPRHGLVAAFMEQANTGMVGHDCRAPVSTIVGRGTTQRLISAQLTHFRGSNRGNADVREPAPTACAHVNHAALLQATLEHDHAMAQPFARERELRAFLIKYYGASTAQDVDDPLGTVTARARFGLVMVAGEAYRIVDIGMRMLDPETELAAAMGVRKGYVLGWRADGRKVTKTDINRLVGNMVSPRPARALIAANCGHLAAPIEERAA